MLNAESLIQYALKLESLSQPLPMAHALSLLRCFERPVTPETSHCSLFWLTSLDCSTTRTRRLSVLIAR